MDLEKYEVFECQMCGAKILMNVSKYDEKKVYPFECWEDQGGCGRKSKFYKLKHDESLIDNILKRLDRKPLT